MSIQAVAWVLDESKATNADRLVLIAVANHIGPTGWAWPNVETISREARLDRATVFRAIERLEESGELDIMRRPGKSNLYGLTAMPGGSQSATPKAEVEGSQSATPPVAQMRPQGSQSATRSIKNHKEPTTARVREATDTSPIITEWVDDGAGHGPNETHREVGLRNVRKLLRRDE